MFKQDFKYYKSKNPLPALENILNFNSPDANRVISRYPKHNPKNMASNFFGLKPVDQWVIYEIVDRPGLIFINNPFSNLGQRYWTIRSLKDYSKKPNKTNLDAQNILPENIDWWSYSQNNVNHNIVKKLRWATLGYHHNWDTKVYTEDMRDIFPVDLALLTNIFATTLGFHDFKAEAAIVNFYHMDSILSGHTDHSEQNFEAPLFSFSFGQTAIFLIGGNTIDKKPIAMFLNSGDVIVMSGEARLAYHGVPKIIHNPNASWSITPCDSWNDCNNAIEEDNLNICYNTTLWQPFELYLRSSRININVRQVLKEGQLKLD